ncbi:MAG: cysteine synthase family protein [Dehalococcoidales bacterium]|nr:cysteine synthase family protein [Dehalococcoidales bacterium]
MYFRNIVNSIGHTSLLELSQLSPNKRVKILAKIEGQNIGGSASIKDRVAKYLIQKAEQSGELTKDKVILEATSGNTGIALALLGQRKGYKVTIVMPASMSMERRKLLQIYGAEIILTDGTYGMKAAISTAREMAEKDDKYYMPDQFNNPANPLAHYETTGAEIIADFPYDKIDIFIAGVGTGGTITGIARRLREKYPSIKVIGVEPPPEEIIQGLKYLGKDVPPFWDSSLISERTPVTSQQAITATKQLLAKESIFAGLSSGAVAYQAIKTASKIDEGNIVIILADSGWKYLSLDFWTKN